MARSLRGEYAGACYHVMARGNRRESALFLKAEKKRGQPFIIAPLQEKGRSERWREPCRWNLNESIPFPEVIRRLRETGANISTSITSRCGRTFYRAAGDVAITPLNYEGLPSVAADFDVVLCAAILESERHGQQYRDFTRRAMEAGVQGNIASLRGQRVTYWGRGGDQHTQWLPGAGPSDLK